MSGGALIIHPPTRHTTANCENVTRAQLPGSHNSQWSPCGATGAARRAARLLLVCPLFLPSRCPPPACVDDGGRAAAVAANWLSAPQCRARADGWGGVNSRRSACGAVAAAVHGVGRAGRVSTCPSSPTFLCLSLPLCVCVMRAAFDCSYSSLTAARWRHFRLSSLRHSASVQPRHRAKRCGRALCGWPGGCCSGREKDNRRCVSVLMGVQLDR